MEKTKLIAALESCAAKVRIKPFGGAKTQINNSYFTGCTDLSRVWNDGRGLIRFAALDDDGVVVINKLFCKKSEIKDIQENLKIPYVFVALGYPDYYSEDLISIRKKHYANTQQNYMRMLDTQELENAFLYCALWTEELEDKCSIDALIPSAKIRASNIINRFLELADPEDLVKYVNHFGKEAESQLGHDLWLSLSGHGAGFFDHMLDGAEDRLQDVCRHMRNVEKRDFYINQVWVTKQGKVSFE